MLLSAKFISGLLRFINGDIYWPEKFNKKIIIDYFKELSDAGLITIFAFVVMPNHVHLIWRQNKMNEKETPFGSFLKYTAHDC
ncbi:MAG: transposase [Ferruginibacter sp.]|nr:transposase [Ferruginibacter sp.]